MLPDLGHDIVPDLLLCICIDGILVVGHKIVLHHTEPLDEVAKTYSQVFDCLAFVRTDARKEELTWLANQQHDKDILWELAELCPPVKCWSFIQILALATAEAVAIVEAKGYRDMSFDTRLRALRWRLQDIYRETEDKGALPALRPSEPITSCACSIIFRREAIFKTWTGGWRAGQSQELPSTAIPVRASAEQVLWLAQYPAFSPILRTLQDRFGTPDVKIEEFLALKAALNIATFSKLVPEWLRGVNVFIRELERMLIDGTVVPEP